MLKRLNTCFQNNHVHQDLKILAGYLFLLILILLAGGFHLAGQFLYSIGLPYTLTHEIILMLMLAMGGFILFILRQLKECRINEIKLATLTHEVESAQERQKAILHNIPAVIYLLDSQQNYKMTWTTPNIQEITGYTKEEYFSSADFWISRVYTEDINHVSKTLAEFPQTKQMDMEYRWRFADGTYHWLRDRSIQTDQRYEGLGDVVGFWLDITDSKRMENYQDALRQLTIQLSAARSYQEAGNFILMEADRLIGWDSCSINIYDPDRETLLMDMNYDLIGGKRQEVPTVIRHAKPTPMMIKTMEEGPQLILRTEEEIQQPPDDFVAYGDAGKRSASMMYVPVRYGKDVVGFLTIQSYTLQAYTRKDLNTLQSIADQCGGAIDRIRVENQLWESEEKYRLLVENINESILITQNDKLIYFNKRFLEMLGYSLEELYHQDYQVIYPPAGLDLLEMRRQRREKGINVPPRYETTMKRKDGRLIDVEANVTIINYQGTLATLAVINDITDRKFQEDQIRYLATHDGLTGLNNHREFYRRFREEVERSTRYQRTFCLLMADLDHFKNINDTYGHPVGDDVLRTVAQLLNDDIRNVDIIARYGGEEISIIMPEIGKQTAIFIAERLRKKVEEIWITIPNGKKVQVTISIGVAVFPEDAEDGDSLIQKADQCLYAAKRAGRNKVQATPLPSDSQY